MHLSNITLLCVLTTLSYHCIINAYHLHYSLVLIFTPTMNSSQMEARRISNLSASFTSIPHQALLDHHCACITWKFGMSLETFQWPTDQHTTTPQVIGPISISTNTTSHYTPTRIIQYTGHIPIQQDYYHLCCKSSEFQSTADQHMM